MGSGWGLTVGAIAISNPANAGRLASILRENAPAHARVDAAFAETLAEAASALEAAASRRSRAVSHAQKRAALDRASAWVARYRASLAAGSASPSARAIIRAAQCSEDGRGIPWRILLAAWRLPPSAPIE